MDKNCLVIMPIGDVEGYTQGHFGRVYEYVVAPACKLAGFSPIRIDDSSITDAAPLDILKTVLESEMIVCDLSSRSQNVFYAFAVRQVFNLPVALLKDQKTKKVLEIEEFDEVEYDDSLRIDIVQKAIASLADTIKRNFSNKGEVHSLLGRIITKPKPAAVAPEKPVEPEVPKEPSLPLISPVPDYVGDAITQEDIDKLKVGDSLFHISRGKGEITSIKNSGKDKLAGLLFESGSAILVLAATKGYFRKIKS